MSALTMVEGNLAGMAQGELQGAISSLQTICQVVAPVAWSALYQLGIKKTKECDLFAEVCVIIDKLDKIFCKCNFYEFPNF